jgi:hypothetical protein
MTRPVLDVRTALARAALRLVQPGAVGHCSGVTWRQLAAEAKVGQTAARRTVDNMVRAGVLQRVGCIKPEGTLNWQALYAPTAKLQVPEPAQQAQPCCCMDAAAEQLTAVTRTWLLATA